MTRSWLLVVPMRPTLTVLLEDARWPEHAARFARVRDDGRAEGALLAEYGRRCGG